MKKPIIAVDIDDVIAAHAEALIEFGNKKWGTNLTLKDYDEHWAKMWQIDAAEVEKRVTELNEAGFTREFKHYPDAVKVLAELAKRYKLVILTSRRREMSKDTLEWVEKYYPNIFSEIHFAGIWDNFKEPYHLMTNATKAKICQEIGADYLIDDQLKHCVAAAEAGVKGLVFGEYHWNRAKKLPKDVIRVKDWQAILEYFTRTNSQSLNLGKGDIG